ncbi:hypothetical protein AALD22_15645 [Lachnospiraceae bacterium 56-18]
MRTRQMIGLDEAVNGKRVKIQEYTAESPFNYRKNCLVYLPESNKKIMHGSEKDIVRIADQIKRLVSAVHGHTLVLFTSYSLMGNVCKLIRGSLPFGVHRGSENRCPDYSGKAGSGGDYGRVA